MALVGTVLIFILIFGLGGVLGGAVVGSQARRRIEELQYELKVSEDKVKQYALSSPYIPPPLTPPRPREY